MDHFNTNFPSLLKITISVEIAWRVTFTTDADVRKKGIGPRGPIEWPARSPDLIPCDFFLWGVLKDMVYDHNPRTIDQLRADIQNAISNIDIQLCQKVCRSVFSWIECCIKKNGEHFENYRWGSSWIHRFFLGLHCWLRILWLDIQIKLLSNRLLTCCVTLRTPCI